MADIQHQGVMAMVKIDGDQVKLLREQKGLTQLYVATVVQVTTDTISRWENKRYPTIKKENAIRLAEALEVDLESILITEPEEMQQNDIPGSDSSSPTHHLHEKQIQSTSWFSITRLLLLLIAIGTGGGVYLLTARPLVTTIEAHRFLPKQCTLNQPFPIAIEISVHNSTKPISVIVKEELPANFSIIAASPTLPVALPATGSLKWLAKIEDRAVFTYIVKISSPDIQPIRGSISTGNDKGVTSQTLGPDTIAPSRFHWADTNGDNIISDQEILLVYDQYGELETLGVNVDLIEEIWLGSGYSYDEKKQTYEILP